MTMIARYATKKDLKAAIGQRLKYQETSMFGPEYRDTGLLTVCNRPHITGMGREWFAQVTMNNGIIEKVS